MPQKDYCRCEVKKSLKVFGMIFIANNQSAEVEQPSKEPLNFPTTNITTKRPSVLCGSTVVPIGCDHLSAVGVHKLFIQSIAVIGFVTDQALGHIRHDALFHGLLHQFHFSRRSAFCPQGDRKTMAVCNAHDLGALAPFGLPNQAPPFLAGTNVPSTKHSLRSKPPASFSCCAKARSILSITPERTQFW